MARVGVGIRSDLWLGQVLHAIPVLGPLVDCTAVQFLQVVLHRVLFIKLFDIASDDDAGVEMDYPLNDQSSSDNEPHFIDVLTSVNSILVRSAVLALLNELRLAHRKHLDDVKNPQADGESQHPAQK